MRLPRIKPCPFCGASDAFVEQIVASAYRMFCNGCAALGPPVEHGDYGDGRDLETRDATRAWNRRKRPAALAQSAASGGEDLTTGGSSS